MLFERYLDDLEKENNESAIFINYLKDISEEYMINHRKEEIVRDFIAGMTDQYFFKPLPEKYETRSFGTDMMDRRVYRNTITKGSLVSFNVIVKETDLLVHTPRSMITETREFVLKYRGYIESFIGQNPSFAEALAPWSFRGVCPKIISEMIQAGKKADVGPMAAVAGAMAQFVGQDLLNIVEEVVVENGGDIFIKTVTPLTVGIFAGKSPLNLKIGLKVNSVSHVKGVCTSSGTIGHSLSFGKADAVVVVSDACALADAAATSIGNQVKTSSQIQDAITFGKQIPGVDGIIIIYDDKMGIWGDIEIVGL